MGLIKYRPNRRGIRDLLGSTQVGADLLRRAERIATVARAEYATHPPHQGHVDVAVVLSHERVRARAAIIARHPAAQHIEADRRPLGRAIDAAG